MAFHSRHGFWRRQGTTRLTLADAELAVLAQLCTALAELVSPPQDEPPDPLVDLVGIDPDATAPEDPALLRLFPDAYPDDEQAAAEFRRFTQRGLQQAKGQRLDRVRALVAQMSGLAGDGAEATLQLTGEDAEAFLGSLNDLRLVLGSRLGIVSDDADVTAGWAADDPRHHQHDLYQWLTWLQSSLLDTLAG